MTKWLIEATGLHLFVSVAGCLVVADAACKFDTKNDAELAINLLGFKDEGFIATEHTFG
jgi:deferrochelatase/peroxidase EfeB